MKTQPFKNRKSYGVLKAAFAAVFWIGLWQLAAVIVNKELLIPGPIVVVKRIGLLVTGGPFWIKTGATLLRVVGGFAAGVVVGTVLAVLASFLEPADAVITPFIRIIRSMPVASFVILVMLWISYTYVPVLIAALLVSPIVYLNLREGILNTDRELLEVARIFKFGKLKTAKIVYIPSVKPYFVSAAVTSLGLAWKAGIAAEVLCLPSRSIGREIYYSKLYLETPDLFAWTVVVVIFSFLLEKLLQKLVKNRKKEASERPQSGFEACIFRMFPLSRKRVFYSLMFVKALS